MTEPDDDEATDRDPGGGTTVCLVREAAAVDALADAGLDTVRAASVTEVERHLGADCLVVDPDRLDGTPAGLLSTVRDRDPDCPVVWLTDDPAGLGEGAFGAATTVVERDADPDEWSFLVEKVRAILEDPTAPGHGPDLYRMLVESARDGLYILDANARVTYLNESFAEMLGYEREELRGRHASMTMADGELERGQRLVGELIDSDSRESEVIDMEMETKHGDRVTVSINFVVLTDEDGTYEGLMGVVRDITDRKARERELERYETIVETATEPIYVLDEDERFVRVNDAMTNELGYGHGELLGSHIGTVTDDRGVRRHEDLIADLVEGTREQASTEVEMEAADGTIRQYDLSIAVIRENGEFGGTVVTAHDVTDLRVHQRQLSVLDRVLRHNVRNKMSVVIGHASDIASSGDEGVARRAEAIEKASTELLALSDSAREFESVFADDAPRTDRIDVVDIAVDVVEELRLEHPAADIDATFPDEAPARGHETFELALNELVENAIVHNDRDPPSVDVTVAERPDAVEIRVADDGPGINETDRDALLRGAESPLEHSQGLGLWLVRWSVEMADGDIDIEDDEPRGTVVTVRLPTPGE